MMNFLFIAAAARIFDDFLKLGYGGSCFTCLEFIDIEFIEVKNLQRLYIWKGECIKERKIKGNDILP